MITISAALRVVAASSMLCCAAAHAADPRPRASADCLAGMQPARGSPSGTPGSSYICKPTGTPPLCGSAYHLLAPPPGNKPHYKCGNANPVGLPQPHCLAGMQSIDTPTGSGKAYICEPASTTRLCAKNYYFTERLTGNELQYRCVYTDPSVIQNMK